MPKESRMSIKEERRAMWEMRMQGRSIAEIAREFGLSVRSVHFNLKHAAALMDATKMLEVEAEVDLQRLEKLLSIYFPRAIGGRGKDGKDHEPDMESGFFVLKVLDQKAKLLGLNAPKRVDINVILEQFAAKHGLDHADVVEAAYTLLPEQAARP